MMPGVRLAIPLFLAAALLAGMAFVAADLGDPGRARMMEPIPDTPAPPVQVFTSIEDLREFARAAYTDLSDEDWSALENSLIPGSGETCATASLEDHGAEAVRRAALDVEAALARENSLFAQLARLPRLDWEVVGVEVNGGEAWITRRASAFGLDVGPPVLRRDRWVVVSDAWWLDPLTVAPGCGAEAGEARAALAYEAVTPSTFPRPLLVGSTVEAVSADGRAIEVTMTVGERGPSLLAPDGFEYVHFEAKVDSRDGSQLGGPLTFRSASFDGWFLGQPIATSTGICPGTEATGVTCQLTSGKALVGNDDPAPRLAWTPRAAHQRAEGIAWWRLPTLRRGGRSVVRDLTNAEVSQAVAAASIPVETWETDFSRMTIDPAEVLVTGTRPNTIPALTIGGLSAGSSVYDAIEEANVWLDDVEPVLAVEAGGEARAYPLRVLLWHQIVNDELGGEPVLATYSPLSNAAAVFERRAGVSAPVFLTSGALRFSNLVMYDEATESWWQQATGEAIAGELAGLRLTPMPGLLISWGDFKRAFPEGSVVSVNSGFGSDYDFNPYFDVDFSSPSLLEGEPDPRLPAHARVLGLRAGGEALAVSFAGLDLEPVVQRDLGGAPIVVFWRRGTASALSHATVALGRDVGAAVAFDPRIDGETLTFAEDGGLFVDAQTGSAWDLTGVALGGPLEGRRLRPLAQTNSFWFSWAAFNPDTAIVRGALPGG